MILPDSIRGEHIKVENSVQKEYTLRQVTVGTQQKFCNTVIIRNNDPVGSLYVSKFSFSEFTEPENVNKWDKFIVPPSSSRKFLLYREEQKIYLVNVHMEGEDVEIIQMYDTQLVDVNCSDDFRSISYISDLNVIKPATIWETYEITCALANTRYLVDIHTPIDTFYSKLILSDYTCNSTHIMRLSNSTSVSKCITSKCDKPIILDNLLVNDKVYVSSDTAGKVLCLHVFSQPKGVDTVVTV